MSWAREHVSISYKLIVVRWQIEKTEQSVLEMHALTVAWEVEREIAGMLWLLYFKAAAARTQSSVPQATSHVNSKARHVHGRKNTQRALHPGLADMSFATERTGITIRKFHDQNRLTLFCFVKGHSFVRKTFSGPLAPRIGRWHLWV